MNKENRIALEGLLVSFTLAAFVFVIFFSIAGSTAKKTFDRSFTKCAVEVADKLKEIKDESSLIPTVKKMNRQSSCRYALYGAKSKVLYDTIIKSDSSSMLVKAVPFSIGGNFYQLRTAISQNEVRNLIEGMENTLLSWGIAFSCAIWVILLVLFQVLSRLRSFTLHDELGQVEKETILDYLDEGVLIVDREMRVQNANRRAAQMFGVLKTRLLGGYFSEEIKRPPLAMHCLDGLSRCKTTGFPISGAYTENNPTRTYYDFRILPAHDNAMVVVIQDQSSHYRMMKMGKDFIANASHELRTPITIIRGFIETLSEMNPVSEAMLQEIIEKVMRNCTRMENLIKNLLILADLDYLPKSQKRECDLGSIIDSCSHTIKSVHEDVDIELYQNKEKVTIDGDPDLLELAISNLLQNAVKYSPGRPQLKVKLEEILGEVRVTVCDKGCGIAEKDLRNIFNRFYTVDKARSRKLGGAGLGLSIVKMIVERHEGTVSARSKIGEGSEFTASLPKN